MPNTVAFSERNNTVALAESLFISLLGVRIYGDKCRPVPDINEVEHLTNSNLKNSLNTFSSQLAVAIVDSMYEVTTNHHIFVRDTCKSCILTDNLVLSQK